MHITHKSASEMSTLLL